MATLPYAAQGSHGMSWRKHGNHQDACTNLVITMTVESLPAEIQLTSAKRVPEGHSILNAWELSKCYTARTLSL